LELQGEAFLVLFQAGDLFLGHGGQFRFGRFGLEQFAVFRQLAGRAEKTFALGHQVFEPGVFAGQRLGVLRVVKNLGIA